MRRGRNAAARLRAAVDMLPIETKQAMLVALEDDAIVTGAYTHDGGVCPMLAGHRRGGGTGREGFAKCWDRYTGANKGRAASEREVRTLRTMLEASLLDPFDIHELERPRRDSGERNRMPELRARHGWAWSRLFRRWDTYAAHVAAIEQAESEPAEAGDAVTHV